MWAVPEQHLVLHRGDFCRHCFENRWEIPLDIFFRTPKKSQAVGPELTCGGPWVLSHTLDTSWKLRQGRCALHTELPDLGREQDSTCSTLWPTEGQEATSGYLLCILRAHLFATTGRQAILWLSKI